MAELYLSNYSQELDRVVVVEGDEHSVWAYVLTPDQKGIDFDGFLCSRGTLAKNSEEIKSYMEAGCAPPLFAELSTESAIQEDLQTEDIQILWEEQAANIFIRQELFLVMDIATKTAYSKAVKEDSPYGMVLREDF